LTDALVAADEPVVPWEVDGGGVPEPPVADCRLDVAPVLDALLPVVPVLWPAPASGDPDDPTLPLVGT
jgi:hypothetical protein